MLKRIFFPFPGLILAGMALAPLALAQPLGQPVAGGGGSFQERFLEVKRAQMGPALGVNQQTVDRLLMIEQRYNPQRRQLIQVMKADYQRLQQVMSQPSPSEQEVAAILSDMKRSKQAMEDLQNRQGEEEEALLTPVQQARYLMYQKNLMQQARRVMKGPGMGETEPLNPQMPRDIPVVGPAYPGR